MMQKLSFALILFYYSLVALCATSIVYCLAPLFIEQSSYLRLFNYSSSQVKWILGTVMCNMSALFARTIATQNEKSGLITLISYIGFVYAFLGDTFIFNESYTTLQMCSIFVILAFNVALVI